MANTIKVKRSAVPGKVPTTGDLQLGELAINTYDGKLYTRKDDGAATIVEIGAGGGGGGGISDGDKGDVVVSNSGATWTIDNDAVTYAKLQNVSVSDVLLGRSTAGSGNVEEIACTQAGRNLLDDVDAAAQRTTLGLGTLATQSALGNISSAGAIGSTANLPLITTTSGVVAAGSFGTAANTFCQGNDGRLSDVRTPTDSSVTDVKVAAAANITGTKIQAASTTVRGTVQLNNTVTSTSTTLAATANAAKLAYDIGNKKSITITSPGIAEKIVIMFTATAMTLTQIRSVIIGGTSVDFRINYGTDVSLAGTDTTTSAIIANSTTTGVSTTTFSSATVPANNFVWLTTSAVSGNVGQLHVTLVF